MTGQDTNPSLFFTQLSDVAPAIAKLLNQRHARIRANVTTHDVEGGYGFAITYQVWVEVFTRKCGRCNEHEYSRPRFDCIGHRYQTVWLEIASGEGNSLADALSAANTRVNKWLADRQEAA